MDTNDPSALALAGMKRRPVRQACSHCASAHLSCSDVRPCERCDRRGLQCSERQRKRRRVDGQGVLVPNHVVPPPRPSWTPAPEAAPRQVEEVHARSYAILSAYRQAREADRVIPAPSTAAPSASASSPFVVSQLPSPDEFGVTLKANTGDMFLMINSDHPAFGNINSLEWGLRQGPSYLGTVPSMPALNMQPMHPQQQPSYMFPTPSPSSGNAAGSSFSPIEAMLSLSRPAEGPQSNLSANAQ